MLCCTITSAYAGVITRPPKLGIVNYALVRCCYVVKSRRKNRRNHTCPNRLIHPSVLVDIDIGAASLFATYGD